MRREAGLLHIGNGHYRNDKILFLIFDIIMSEAKRIESAISKIWLIF